MSTASPAPPRTQSSPASSDRGDVLIGEHLEAVRAALWRSAIANALLRWLGGLMAAVLLFAIVDHWLWGMGKGIRFLFAAAAVGGSLWWIVTRIVPLIRLRISPEYAAYSIEHDAPDLQHALTSYVTLRDDRAAPGLRGIVVRSIGARAARQLQSAGMAMPTETSGTFRLSMIVLAIFAALALYAAMLPSSTGQSLRRLATPLSDVAPPTRVRIADVQPGNSELLYGRELEISAEVRGLRGDEQPTVVVETASGLAQRRAMQMGAAGERFQVSLPPEAVRESFVYSIEAGDARSEAYEIVVRDEPSLVVRRVDYAPPAYTGLPRRSSSVPAVEGLAGSTVTVTATTNRPVVSGRIEFNPRPVRGRISATAGFAALDIAADGRSVTATWDLRASVGGNGQTQIDSYRLVIEDASGSTNPDPVVYPIRIIPDLAPEVRIAVPNSWPKDVPLGSQQLIEVRAVDPDFGLTEISLRIRRKTQIDFDPVLLESNEGVRGNQVALYRFRPDDLGYTLGDRITIEAVARDNRPRPATSRRGRNRPDPGVTVSDPIELQIVERPARAPREDGDGLQPKDQQPSGEQSSDSGDEGESGAGGGGGGGGEAASGEGQGEGNQSGGSGESESGESSAQGEGAGDSGGSEAGDRGGQNEGGATGGNQASTTDQENASGDGSSDAQPGNPGEPNQDAAAEPNTPDPADNAQAPPEDGAGSTGDRQPAGRGDAASGTADGQEPPNGSPDSQQPAQPGADSAGADSAGDAQPSGGGPSAGQSGGDPQRGSQPPPASDGEAIERIRDYLRRQQEAAEQQSAEQGNNAERDIGQREAGDRGGEQPSPAEGGEGTNAENSAGDAAPQPQPPQQTPQSNEGSAPSTADGQRGERSDPQETPSPIGNGDAAQSQDGSGRAGQQPEPRDTGADGAPSGSPQPGQSPQPDDSQQPSQSTESGAEPTSDPAQSASDAAADRSDQTAGDSGEAEGGTDAQSGETPGDGPESDANSDANSEAGGDPAGENQTDPQSTAGSQADSTEQAGGEGGGTDGGGTAASDAAGDASDAPSADPPGSQPPEDAADTTPESTPPAGTGAGQRSGAGTSSPPGEPAGDPQAAGAGAADGSGQGQSSPLGERPAGGPAAPPAPDPVDVEAARKATDLVLDSLEHQRDTPDPELLEELGWSPEQLRRFIDRWQQARELGQSGDAEARQNYEEALRSLGIRPTGPGDTPRRAREINDRLRGVRDSGGTMKAPPQFRDRIRRVLEQLNRR